MEDITYKWKLNYSKLAVQNFIFNGSIIAWCYGDQEDQFDSIFKSFIAGLAVLVV